MQTSDFRQISPELKKRVLTAVIGAPILVVLIYYCDLIGIFFLTTVISLGMVFEFCEITLSMADKTEKKYVLLFMTWLLHLLNLLIPQTEIYLVIFSFMILFSYFLFTVKRFESVDLSTHMKELMYSTFGLIYLVFIPMNLIKIHSSTNGVRWTLLFLVMIWAVDISAYFVGKKFGKRKLYSEISPKKTVEGACGGLVAAVLSALIFKLTLFKELPWIGVYLLPVVIGAMAQIGDLCESFLKRSFDRKDAGSILPGHGGFLDRFDGVVFSLPIMYTWVRILN